MDSLMSVRDLILKLSDEDPDDKVMITVVKYPEQFELRRSSTGGYTWDHNQACESVPLEIDEAIRKEPGMIFLTVELTEYTEAPGSVQGSGKG